MKLQLIALVALCAIALAEAGEVPAKFLGSWDVGESENFKEYLAAKGERPFWMESANILFVYFEATAGSCSRWFRWRA